MDCQSKSFFLKIHISLCKVGPSILKSRGPMLKKQCNYEVIYCCFYYVKLSLCLTN
jgi:hypothetical protein